MTTKVLQDKDLQEHYDQVFAMYGTRGWARLQAHQATHEAAYNELLAQQEGGDAAASTGGIARVVAPE